MKPLLLTLSLSVLLTALAPLDADARRLGGGGSSGMQRSLPARTTPSTTPVTPVAPTPKPAQAAPTAPATAAAPAAAAPRRSWLGPIAGLAAGLGIAALMSHLGMGEGFANFMTMLLLAFVAFVAIRWLLRRFGPKTAAPMPMAATPNGAPVPDDAAFRSASNADSARTIDAGPGGLASVTPATASSRPLPADFDATAFERVARLIFIRLQAANDRGDLDDLRSFTTPEMFAAARLDLQDRGTQPQQTDVVRVDAEVLDVTREAQQQVVSVRFHGLIREEPQAATAPFDEVWHLVRPLDGSREWAIAGIQQSAAA